MLITPPAEPEGAGWGLKKCSSAENPIEKKSQLASFDTHSHYFLNLTSKARISRSSAPTEQR